MARDFDYLLVICADRDNDLGRKAGVNGPVVGRKANLNAAAKLALEDPGETDANTMFAAVKKYDELKKEIGNVEVATITGASKLGFESDKKLNSQIDSVLEKFPAKGFVLVTDGAEDDQVIPLLQSRAPVVSKEIVVVKQANQVESTYYTLKEALKDPDIARIVFLVPGIVILLWGALYFANSERFFYQVMSLVVGSYLILKGTGLENIIADNLRSAAKAISLQRVSFPLYLLSGILTALWLYSLYSTLSSRLFAGAFEQVISALGVTINFLSLAALGFTMGNAIDSVVLKKAIHLKTHFIYASAVIIFWYLLDAGLKVAAGEPYADLAWFFGNVLAAFAASLAAYRLSGIIDITKKATKLLLGLPVYSKDGRIIGLVEEIDKPKKTVKYKDYKTNSLVSIGEGKFLLRKNRLLLTA